MLGAKDKIIMYMLAKGAKHSEIAAVLQCHMNTVYRRIKKIRKHWGLE